MGMTTNILQTTDHEMIRKWAIHFMGAPYLAVSGNKSQLAIGIPGEQENETILISWNDWLTRFEEEQLILEYKQQKEAGEKFPYYRLISRPGSDDRHLQAPAEANRDKHINFLEQEENS